MVNVAVLIVGHRVGDAVGMVGRSFSKASMLDVVVNGTVVHVATVRESRNEGEVIVVF